MSSQSWNSYEQAAEKGPLALAVKVTIGLALLGCLWWGIGAVCANVNEAAQVAQQELGAKALLRKYEWFKDAKAALDAKRATIQVYESRIPRISDPERRDIAETELAGVIASYNGLAADYNAAMAKANWQFTNVGALPAGATEPLPRSVAPYLTTTH